MARKKSISALKEEAKKLLDEVKKLEEEGYRTIGKTISDLHKKGTLTLDKAKEAVENTLK